MLEMKVKTSDRYKDSGVDWLGEIPESWEACRFKFLYSESNAGAVIDKGYWHCGSELLFTCQKTPMKSSYSSFKKHLRTKAADLLLTRNGTPYVHLPSEGAIYSNVVQRVRLKSDYHRKYIWYALSNSCLSLKGYGDIIESFNMSTWDGLLVPLPHVEIQERIVPFLDKKTAQLDEAVAIKEKQITLLKERKQILIQNAVTQGLNPNAPMRDSGVEWIGEIPEHWEVKRAKYLFREVDERSTSGEEELLSVSHMTGVTPRSEKNVSMFLAEDYSGSKTCQKNDLVFNIMWAWMGALGVSDKAGIVSSSYGIFRQLTLGTFNSKFLEWLLKVTSYIEHYNKVSTGLHSSRLRFYSHMFFNMEIGCPTRQEQNEIVAHIETQSAKIDQAIDLSQQQIDKLKEYKATLINSAVTGKIKVFVQGAGERT